MSTPRIVTLVAVVAALSAAGGWWLGQRRADTPEVTIAKAEPAQPQILY